ncbi:YhhA family cyclophane-containing RiPP [Microvirgula aerodenitrificans]|uniref:YhhA family cyclophane-containing RiPP n=1 Tax=Microvirgula aerodenitrificans TaxID=57480 RepID=UPI00248DA0C6|nr:YhhA family cyclophane-containing RiPP [Microvirgula aerodenitrificans]
MDYQLSARNDLGPYFGCANESMEIDLSLISSVTLARLVEEVKNEDLTVGGRYDRTHNKHNR